MAGGELVSSRQARMKKFYGDWRSLLDKLDFNKLGQEDKIDYLLFRIISITSRGNSKSRRVRWRRRKRSSLLRV